MRLCQFLGTASVLTAALIQPAQAMTLITDVDVQVVGAGVRIILTTAEGASVQTYPAQAGDRFIVDLTNTQLRLPAGEPFVADNPSDTIAQVRVAPLDANSVRITVEGRTEALAGEVAQTEAGLVLAIAPETAALPSLEPPEPETAPAAPEGALQVVVTGQASEDRFLVPEASTGTRTDTSLFEVPQSIQVIPEAVLESQQVIRLNEAIRNIPSAIQGNTFGGTSEEFILRGFEGVTILRDGFRTGIEDFAGGFEETANIERVEVLQGPASILYGNLQPGGVINVVTEEPTDEFAFESDMQLGSYGLARPRLNVSGPATTDGSVRYRLNAAYETRDGFRDFETDVDRYFVAPTIAWAIDDDTDLTLELEYVDDRRPFDRGIPALGDEIADVPRDTIIGEPGDFAETEVLNVGYRLEHRFSEAWTLRNRFRYSATDFLNLRTELNQQLGGLDETTGDVARSFDSNDSRLESFEVQTELTGEFSTGSIDHTLLLALDAFFVDSAIETTIDFAPPVNLFDPQIGRVPTPDLPLQFTINDSETELDRFGVLLQDQITLTPELNLLLGGRLDFINQRIDSAEASIPGLFFSPAFEEDRRESAFSPRVGIVYQPVEPLSIYASYSRSFQPNSLTQTTVEGDFLDPEEAEQFEVGLKAELIENRLAATLSFFDITQTNVAATDPDNPDFVVPIGEQTSRGLDFSLQGEILPGWNVIASYGLLDAEIQESPDFPAGAQPRNVADNTASLFTTYEIQRGRLQGLGFGVGLFYVGDRPGDDANTFELDSYLRTDATIFYEQDNLRLGLNFRNLFDVRFFESSVDRRGAIPGDPFTVQGTLSIRF